VTQDSLSGFVLEEKPVVDWNNVAVGTVMDIRKDPRRGNARHLVVNLTPAAQDLLGVHDELITIPINHVFGIRRDQVRLDRSIQELARIEQLQELTR